MGRSRSCSRRRAGWRCVTLRYTALLSLKSGGQTVWISKAISDAVGIYQQDAAGVHYECLFSDEADDGLTQDRKRMFWAMDRAALEAGGFTRRIFVSHTPAAIEMADTVINMDNLAR